MLTIIANVKEMLIFQPLLCRETIYVTHAAHSNTPK